MSTESPILITGCPRSGSTMVAAAIQLCGAFAGRLSPRGMYCNDRIRNTIVKPYFKKYGFDPEGQFPIPDTNGLIMPADWQRRVEFAIFAEGHVKGPWMYKDARNALIWPVWHEAFPTAKWVIVRRRTGDVLESCIKTNYMKAFKDPEKLKYVHAETEKAAWLWYVHEYERKFVEMISSGLNCKIIWPERMLPDRKGHVDFNQMKEIVEWLGLEWNPGVIDIVNKLLWGNSIKERSVAK